MPAFAAVMRWRLQGLNQARAEISRRVGGKCSIYPPAPRVFVHECYYVRQL